MTTFDTRQEMAMNEAAWWWTISAIWSGWPTNRRSRKSRRHPLTPICGVYFAFCASQRGLQKGIGMSTGGGAAGEQRLASFALSISERSNKNKGLSVRSAALSARLKTPTWKP